MISEKAIKSVSVIGVFMLAVIMGAFLMHKQIQPAPFFKDAFVGGEALVEKMLTNKRSELKVNMWQRLRFLETGVVTHNPARAYNGYTMVTNAAFSGAWLLDMKGEIVHQWKAPFRKVWPKAPHVDMPVKEELIYWRRAWLYPNGDVLAIYEANGDTPWGYGLAKLDKDSNVLWSFAERTHHDMFVDEEGKIYLLTHRILKNPPRYMNFVEAPYIDDSIVILSPEGKELDRISIVEAYHRSIFMNDLYMLAFGRQYDGNFLHVNTVKVIPQKMDGVLPFLKKGYITIASRNLNIAGVIDPKEKKLVWRQTGSWIFLHDPEFTMDGTVILFDNYGDYMRSGTSRVIEYNPLDMSIVWEWHGQEDRPLHSQLRGFKQILPNGNLLVTEADSGRLLEVTRDKEIVWEYINPERKTSNGRMSIAVLSGARRFTPDQLPFLDEVAKPKVD
ncbi:MAG: arylsulfotransferase family protein [Nitrospinota bacterium]|nr:arylsulfotransferase family protein [Nitrospinota bacterium]